MAIKFDILARLKSNLLTLVSLMFSGQENKAVTPTWIAMQAQSQEITPEFFIHPNVNLDKGSQELTTMVTLSKEQLRQRWNTDQGKYILAKWKGKKFDRATLDSLIGRYYDHTDLRGIPLKNEKLNRADLSKSDFYGAIFENADLSYTNLEDSWLSESNIKGTCFDYARMNSVLIDNVEFNKKTSFVGVSLKTINFNLAALLQDYATNQQRIANLNASQPVLAFFLKITTDYGRSFTRFFICCAIVIFVFGLLYAIFPNSISKSGFWNGLYFSAMAFTPLGANIQPVSIIGRVLALLEAYIGLLMTGLLVAILVKKTVGD